MRTYLVIMDETKEAATALRFAARRAIDTHGNVHLLALIPPQPFNAFAGVQATIEEEARVRAETMASSAAGSLLSESGLMPIISVAMGEGKKVVREYLEKYDISALVLGAACDGQPGPLVTHFTGDIIGQLPCPVFVIPGSLSPEAIDAIS